MTIIQQAINYGREQLNHQVEHPQQEALLLLAHTVSKSKEFLFAHSDEPLEDSLFQKYQQYLSRRIQGEPIAYIQQQKEFWSLPLQVTSSVLIPRPETELIIEIALDLLAKNNTPRILDLGTGSGCIALALAKEKPQAEIIACDNSSSCIDIAKINAKNLSISNVSFLISDWFESINNKHFDIIISNPPYIARDDSDLDNYVEQFEPESALFSGHGGLEDLFHIIQYAHNYLSSNGTLILEHGYKQGRDVRIHFDKCGYNKIQTLQDMQHHDRVTHGAFAN